MYTGQDGRQLQAGDHQSLNTPSTRRETRGGSLSGEANWLSAYVMGPGAECRTTCALPWRYTHMKGTVLLSLFCLIG